MKSAQEKAAILVEALPWIKRYSGKRVVIKYGGKAMVDEGLKERFATDVVLLKYCGIEPVIVHGGGRQISAEMEAAGLPVRFVGGLRVTDEAAIGIVKRVLSSINAEVVSLLNRHGEHGRGIIGDEGLIACAPKPPVASEEGPVELGFVGDVSSVSPAALTEALDEGLVPVVATLGTDGSAAYNVNADTAAAAIAGAIGAEKLVFLTDVEGIFEDFASRSGLVSQLDLPAALALRDSGRLDAGMIPKLQSCIDTVERGVNRAHIIDGTVEHALLLEIFTDEGIGTMVKRS